MWFWELLNKPIVVTVVSFLFAGVAGAALSQRWQRHAKLMDLQIQQLRDLEQVYHHYFRLLKGDVAGLSGEGWDTTHAQLFSLSQFNRSLFRGESARLGWTEVAQHMATLRDHRRKVESADVREQLDQIRSLAEHTRASIIREITGHKST